MKICVTSRGNTLESALDPRFGRAAYFIIVDSENTSYDAIENKAAVAAGGAGITAAQTVVDKKVKAVITGNVGPNALNVLKAADIEIYQGISASVKENLEEFKKGNLKKLENAVPSHFGLKFQGENK